VQLQEVAFPEVRVIDPIVPCHKLLSSDTARDLLGDPPFLVVMDGIRPRLPKCASDVNGALDPVDVLHTLRITVDVQFVIAVLEVRGHGEASCVSRRDPGSEPLDESLKWLS